MKQSKEPPNRIDTKPEIFKRLRESLGWTRLQVQEENQKRCLGSLKVNTLRDLEAKDSGKTPAAIDYANALGISLLEAARNPNEIRGVEASAYPMELDKYGLVCQDLAASSATFSFFKFDPPSKWHELLLKCMHFLQPSYQRDLYGYDSVSNESSETPDAWEKRFKNESAYKELKNEGVCFDIAQVRIADYCDVHADGVSWLMGSSISTRNQYNSDEGSLEDAPLSSHFPIKGFRPAIHIIISKNTEPKKWLVDLNPMELDIEKHMMKPTPQDFENDDPFCNYYKV